MKLIFLISQPRSGSSLLQNLLSSQKEISSDVENWLLLPLLCFSSPSLSDDGYSSIKSAKNICNFLSKKNRRDIYYNFIRKLYSQLYYSSCKNGEYVLDKTPRYYHIIKELSECFPEPKIIFLVRNPLAVLSSIINYNYYGKWYMIFSADRMHDLFTCIEKIVFNQIPNCCFIKYENLVHNPEEELFRLMKFLSICIDDIDIQYDVSSLSDQKLGYDKKSLTKHNKPVTTYESQWLSYFSTPQRKVIGLYYINTIPAEFYVKFNYSRSKLTDLLNFRWYHYFFMPISFRILFLLYNHKIFSLLKLIFFYDNLLSKIFIKNKSLYRTNP